MGCFASRPGGMPGGSARGDAVVDAEGQLHAAQEEAAGPVEVESASSQVGRESKPLVCTVTLLDGAELRLELDATATVHEAYAAAAAARGLPVQSIQLVAKGQQRPLERSSECLEAATGGVYDLLLVASRGVRLAESNDEGIVPGEVTFEHFPDECFGGLGHHEMEHFAGRMFTAPYDGAVWRMLWHGARFWRAHEDPMTEAAPLWGRVMLRVVLHGRPRALGAGFGTPELSMSADPEDSMSFFGLYRWGFTHVCSAGEQMYKEDRKWQADQRLAVLFDFDAGTMQCFFGPEKFGPLVSGLPKDNLWPVILVLSQCSASLSVESTVAEAGVA